MKENFDELLKDAIACNDFYFLETNSDKYDINHRFADEENDTLLLYSISDAGSNTYSLFIKNGADITLVNDEGEGIVHAIVYSGIENRLVEFLKTYKDNINVRTHDGVTPLLLAISINNIEMAKILIDEGADVNIGDIEGVTPLHLAAQQEDVDLVAMLLNKGADIRQKTKRGNYPLALAVNGDYDEIAKYLFSKMY
jgi:ankyrin repeat protein